MLRTPISLACALALAGCQPASGPPDDASPAPAGVSTAQEPAAGPATIAADDTDTATFDAISAGETVRFTGTEPFWGGQVVGSALTYSTPEQPDGNDIAVTRFAGRGGVSWSGTYAGARFVLAVTPGTCSDGMSDRTYPFVATLEVSGEQRSGCAWTERKPFTGPTNP